MENTNARFNEDVQKLTPENANGIILDVGMPSDILLSAGVENKPLRLYGNKVMKKVRKHGFYPADLKNLPKAISDPIFVFDDYLHGGRTILTELKIGSNNVLVAVDAGKPPDINFNIIKSTFGKSAEGVIGWINKGNLLYTNKEKALDYMGAPALLAGASSNQGPTRTLSHSYDPAPIASASNGQEVSKAKDIVKNFKNPAPKYKDNILQ